MTADLHSSVYSRYMEASGLPNSFIEKFSKRYPYAPANVVSTLCGDDMLCGLGGITFGGDLSCSLHDLETLAASLGYPVTTNSETALKFFGLSLIRSVKNPRNFLLAIPKAVIGSSVGWAMWLGRLAIRRRRESKNGMGTPPGKDRV